MAHSVDNSFTTHYKIIVDVWNSLSDTVVKSTSVASFKINLGAVDLSRFLTVV